MPKLRTTIFIGLVSAGLGAAAAQEPPRPPQPPQPPDTAALEAQRAELEAARAQLEASRAELERAAQEVAILSARRNASRNASRYARTGGYGYGFGRPQLGLNIANDEDGVRVIGVSPGGPGSDAGVEIGDLIVSIDDVDVDASAGSNPSRRFLEVLGEVESGAEVELELLRDGTPMTVAVESRDWNIPEWVEDIGDRVNVVVRDIPNIANRGIVRVMEQPFFFGAWSEMELVELTPGLGQYFGTESGLLVVRAPEGDDIDLRDGDVILEISGREPQSVGHAMRILRSFEPEETLELTIMREQRRQTIAVDVPGYPSTVDVD